MDTEVREGRGSALHLLEENLSDCFAGPKDLPAGGRIFFFFFLIASQAKFTLLILYLAL